MHPAIVGALINSALYLLCVFVAGLVTGHPLAWKAAVTAMGLAYLGYVTALLAAGSAKALAAQVRWLAVSNAIVSASMSIGALAGILLLV